MSFAIVGIRRLGKEEAWLQQLKTIVECLSLTGQLESGHSRSHADLSPHIGRERTENGPDRSSGKQQSQGPDAIRTNDYINISWGCHVRHGNGRCVRATTCPCFRPDEVRASA